MTLLAVLTSLLLAAASPPPPPPTAPEVAQGEFDGYAGPELWRAWQRATYDSAANGAHDLYARYNTAQPGESFNRLGPRAQRASPFYWTEALRFAFNEVCQNETCQWRYHEVAIAGEMDDFDTIAERTFDGRAAADYLRANGVEPGHEIIAEHRAFGRQSDLDEAVSGHLRLVSHLESDCADVGLWEQRYQRQIAPEQAVSAGDEPPPPPPPPLPFNISMQIDLPGWVVGADEPWVRREDSRDRALLDLLEALPPGC
ncbi:hypothetical protein [Hyphobacterium sp.]|uniref:hypothetical protein n=1 Tax=Hyphobacterium sp. TaxID=2004662 RepID=UPI003B5184D2